MLTLRHAPQVASSANMTGFPCSRSEASYLANSDRSASRWGSLSRLAFMQVLTLANLIPNRLYALSRRSLLIGKLNSYWIRSHRFLLERKRSSSRFSLMYFSTSSGSGHGRLPVLYSLFALFPLLWKAHTISQHVWLAIPVMCLIYVQDSLILEKSVNEPYRSPTTSIRWVSEYLR